MCNFVMKDEVYLLTSCLRHSAAGVGTQFLATATGILMMAMLGMFNVHRHGSINTASILLYALTSCKLHCHGSINTVSILLYGLTSCK